MAKIEEFKEFVRKNPKLLTYVNKGEKTWQDFYEIYDIYGEESVAWTDYLNHKVTSATGTMGLAEIINWIKTLNLDSVQSGVSNLQRVLGVVQDLSSKDDSKIEEYKPRPIYKHFED